jgi:excisionase family DNA binding protein
MSRQKDEAITLPLFSDVGWVRPGEAVRAPGRQRWVCPPPSRGPEGTPRLNLPPSAPAPSTQPPAPDRTSSPELLTAEEAAAWLRTTRKAIYAMAERAQLPGVTRIGRRLLIRRDVLLSWLDQRGAAPSGGHRR